MNTKKKKSIVHLAVTYALLTVAIELSSTTSHAKTQKFNDAIKRSTAAAEIVGTMYKLSSDGIPRELIDRATAIGVFPCKKTDLLLEHAIICPGAIASRTPQGWSTPAFFRFVAGGFGRPDSGLEDANAMILLFMPKPPVDWLSTLRGVRHAVAGPLGVVTEEQKAEILNAQVIAYSVRRNSLRGTKLKSDSWKGVGVAEDNKINKPLYKLKGLEILAGQKVDSASLPPGITAFQEALRKYWPGH